MKSGDTGLAVHAVQDLATPLHDGHAWTGVNGSYLKHFIGDNLPSAGTIKNAFNNTVQVLQGQNPVQVPSPAQQQQSQSGSSTAGCTTTTCQTTNDGGRTEVNHNNNNQRD
jgi:hypothetical protein